MQPTQHPPGTRRLAVLRSTPVTPRMRRVVLSGDDLLGFSLDPAWWGPYVKLLLPRGDHPPVRRTYSVRAFDPDPNRLEIDVVIHEPRGHASAWAASAAPGDEVGLLGPGAVAVADKADWALFAGDHSALPAIAYTLERLPADARGKVFIALDDAADRQALSCPSGIDVEWVSGERSLEEAVSRAAWPSDGRVILWAGAEAVVARKIRAHGRDVRGLTRDRCVVQNYWRRGMAEGEFSYVD